MLITFERTLVNQNESKTNPTIIAAMYFVYLLRSGANDRCAYRPHIHLFCYRCRHRCCGCLIHEIWFGASYGASYTKAREQQIAST